MSCYVGEGPGSDVWVRVRGPRASGWMRKLGAAVRVRGPGASVLVRGPGAAVWVRGPGAVVWLRALGASE
jgi:hypothetical protein